MSNVSAPWTRVVPGFAPGWVGPLSRKLDEVFASQAVMVDDTRAPLPPVRVLLPPRAYDDLDRCVGGFPLLRGPHCTDRPTFRGCAILRRVGLESPTVDCSGKG